jgi:hypothetical protein
MQFNSALAQAIGTTSIATVYSVPTGKTLYSGVISLAYKVLDADLGTAQAEKFEIYAVKQGDTAGLKNLQYPPTVIEINENATIDLGHNLPEGYAIAVWVSKANAIGITVSGVEI